MQIMRKKLITAIITAALLIAGCSDTANVSEGQDNTEDTIVQVENRWGYRIYVDKNTGVMYLRGDEPSSAFTVMLNADGTPKIWQGEEWKKS